MNCMVKGSSSQKLQYNTAFRIDSNVKNNIYCFVYFYMQNIKENPRILAKICYVICYPVLLTYWCSYKVRKERFFALFALFQTYLENARYLENFQGRKVMLEVRSYAAKEKFIIGTRVQRIGHTMTGDCLKFLAI